MLVTLLTIHERGESVGVMEFTLPNQIHIVMEAFSYCTLESNAITAWGEEKRRLRSSRGSWALSRCLHRTSTVAAALHELSNRLTNSAFGASIICTVNVVVCSSFAEVET